jgi:hypothetical protein
VLSNEQHAMSDELHALDIMQCDVLSGQAGQCAMRSTGYFTSISQHLKESKERRVTYSSSNSGSTVGSRECRTC